MLIQQKITSITSRANSRIREAVKLRKAEYRKARNLFIIEGLRELRLAQEAGIDIREVFFCPEYLGELEKDDFIVRIREKGTSLVEVSPGVYEQIAFGDRQEGLVAIARQAEWSLSGLKLNCNPLIVVLEQVEKPGNLGAVIRSADAAGVDAVICADSQVDIYNPNVVRSSLGALFTLPVVKVESPQAIAWLKANKIRIASAVLGSKLDYTAIDYQGSWAIALGSEEKGLSRLWRDNSDYQLNIPMSGKVDSLNVSVAAGVLIYEALRQRRQGKP